MSLQPKPKLQNSDVLPASHPHLGTMASQHLKGTLENNLAPA